MSDRPYHSRTADRTANYRAHHEHLKKEAKKAEAKEAREAKRKEQNGST